MIDDSRDPPIGGFVAPGWEPVRDAFEANSTVRGELDPDAPVARYWPEFAACGKAGIPLRWVLSHRAGLSGLSRRARAAYLLDWEKMTSLLAAQEPLWEPGTVSGYHAITFGYLAGEVVRRVTGQSLGQFFAAEVAGPLNADFHIGLGLEDLPHCADLVAAPPSERQLDRMAEAFNNGHTGARALLLDRPLGARDATTSAGGWPRSRPRTGTARHRAGAGHDRRVARHPGTGQRRARRFGPNPAAFGHDGAGGSTVSVDPEAGIGFSYVMNRMGFSLVDDPRKMALLRAVYTSPGGVR